MKLITMWKNLVKMMTNISFSSKKTMKVSISYDLLEV